MADFHQVHTAKYQPCATSTDCIIWKVTSKRRPCDLVQLDQQGFKTWATDALKLLYDLRLDPTYDKKVFSVNFKRVIQNKFITTCNTHLQNTMLYPRLRTYRTIKYEYVTEPYLYLVKKSRYREAIAGFRCSSHTLEIERGRHTNPKTPGAGRKCRRCDVIEDEKHFFLMCDMNMEEREYFFQKIYRVYAGFTCLNNEKKFSLILNNDDPQCLSWLGEFLHRSFEKRTADSSKC